MNEAPVITTANTPHPANENRVSTLLNLTATDPERDTLTWSIIGGADASLFSLNASTGALSFRTAQNFESPGDNGKDRVYDVTVQVRDEVETDTQDIQIQLRDMAEAPVITSPTSLRVDENQLVVGTLSATDDDVGATQFWSIARGEDSSHFSLTAAGELTFINPKDFEAPDDGDNNGIYLVTVEVRDNGGLKSSADLQVQLQNVNDKAPVIETLGPFGVDEGEIVITTLSAADEDGENNFTWSIIGGADRSHFSLGTNSGELNFTSAKDFEAGADDDDGDRVYELRVQVSDSAQLTGHANLIVQLRDVNEGVTPDPSAPVIDTLGPFGIEEDETDVTTLEATYSGGGTLTWSITGGVDRSHFVLGPLTGELAFNEFKNFDDPEDGNENNLYQVNVKVSDGTHEATASLVVQLQDVNEPPVIEIQSPLSAVEGQTGVATLEAVNEDAGDDTLTWSIQGGVDAAHFSLTEAGELTFKRAKSLGSPDDDNGDGIYELIVGVSDGTHTTTAEIKVQLKSVQGNSDNLNLSSKDSRSDCGGFQPITYRSLMEGPFGDENPTGIGSITKTHSPGAGGWTALLFMGLMLCPLVLLQWLRWCRSPHKAKVKVHRR